MVNILVKYWLCILIGVVALIIIISIWRNWDKIQSRYLSKKTGDWQSYAITDKRKADLQLLAEDTYDKIHGIGGLSSIHLDKLLSINDNELEYMAKYYENQLSEESLWTDIDDEWLPATNKDEQLQQKLDNLGLR